MLAQLSDSVVHVSHPYLWLIAAGLVVAAVIALWVFIKVQKFIFRMACGFFALLALAAAGWWFFMRH